MWYAFLTLLLSSTLALAMPAHVADSSWNGDDEMDVVEIEGISMSAVEEALNDCKSQGFLLCAFTSTNIQSHNTDVNIKGDRRKQSTVRAVIRSIDDEGVRPGKNYTETSRWRFSSPIDKLKLLGTRGDVLKKAVGKCFADDNDYCVILNIENTEVDTESHEDGRWWRITSAKALVRGYNHGDKN